MFFEAIFSGLFFAVGSKFKDRYEWHHEKKDMAIALVCYALGLFFGIQFIFGGFDAIGEFASSVEADNLKNDIIYGVVAE